MKKGILKFNRVINRYSIAFDDGSDYELHCGDTFMCSPNLNKYIKVRIELDGEWYLITSEEERISIFENMIVKK